MRRTSLQQLRRAKQVRIGTQNVRTLYRCLRNRAFDNHKRLVRCSFDAPKAIEVI